MTNLNFKNMMMTQKVFSDLFFDSEKLTPEAKKELTKTFCLSLHSEVSQLVNSVNYKQHMPDSSPPDQSRILFESVDCVRYVMALLNLWGVTSEEFEEAFVSKNNFLHKRQKLSEKSRPKGQKVIVCDIDDVLSEFRVPYAVFVEERF